MRVRQVSIAVTAVALALFVLTTRVRSCDPAQRGPAFVGDKQGRSAAPHVSRGDGASRVGRADEEIRIAGIVVDESGPVVDANVELLTGGNGTTPRATAAVRTDSSGRFVLGAHPPGRYAVAVTAADHAPSVLAADLRAPAEATRWRDARIELLGCTSPMTVSVTTGGGAPVEGARVVVSQQGAAGASLGVTDAFGVLQTCAPPGSWILSVTARGLATSSRTLEISGRRAEVFVLEDETVARGAIIDAASKNLLEPDEMGEACQVWAVAVTALVGRQPTSPLHFGDCHADSTFEIRGLSPGAYNLFVATKAHASDRPLTIQLTGIEDEEYAVPVSARTMLAGRIMDEKHRPVPDQYIFARNESGARSRTAISDASGRFSMELVPAGNLQFTVEGRTVLSPASWSARSSSVEIVVGGGARIDGFVMAGGRGAQATVAVETAHGHIDVPTRPDGGFSVDNVFGHVVLAAHRHDEMSPTVELDVRPEAQLSITLELAPTVTVDGRLTTKSGAAVAGMWLRALCSDAPEIARESRTSADGSFRLELSRACRVIQFDVITGAHGHMIKRPSPASIRLSDAPTQRADLTLADAADLAIAVVDTSGQPVSGASVSVVDARTSVERRIASTDDSGTARIRSLLHGWYTVTATIAGRRAAMDVEMSRDRSVRLVLQRQGSLVFVAGASKRTWKVLIASWPAMAAIGEHVIAGDDQLALQLPVSEYVVVARQGATRVSSIRTAVRADGETVVNLTANGGRDVRIDVDEFWGHAVNAPLICHAGPSALITAAPPSLFRLPAIPLAGQQLNVTGNDLQIWCVGDPMLTSDGKARLDGASARVVVATPTPGRRPPFGVRASGDDLVIDQVFDDSKGLRAGDIVASIDRTPVKALTPMGLAYALQALPPGEHAVVVRRDGTAKTVTICMQGCEETK